LVRGVGACDANRRAHAGGGQSVVDIGPLLERGSHSKETDVIPRRQRRARIGFTLAATLLSASAIGLPFPTVVATSMVPVAHTTEVTPELPAPAPAPVEAPAPESVPAPVPAPAPEPDPCAGPLAHVAAAGLPLPAGVTYHCPSTLFPHEGTACWDEWPCPGTAFVAINLSRMPDATQEHLRHVVAHEICHIIDFRDRGWSTEPQADACAAEYGF
jgi:hypothetical protein